MTASRILHLPSKSQVATLGFITPHHGLGAKSLRRFCQLNGKPYSRSLRWSHLLKGYKSSNKLPGPKLP